MIYYYSFREEWSPYMDKMLGYYYENEEIAIKRLLENGYVFDEEEDCYVNDWSNAFVVGVKKYKGGIL